MDDQLYPQIDDAATNGLFYATEDVELKEERQAEDGVLMASYPIMEDVSDWFKEAIDDCDSLSNIDVTKVEFNGAIVSRNVSVEGQVLAYQLLRQLLMDKLGKWGEFGEGSS